MYFKDIESSAKEMTAHNDRQRKNAAERRAKNAKWKKDNKGRKAA
jgi:hypothetical protein